MNNQNMKHFGAWMLYLLLLVALFSSFISIKFAFMLAGSLVFFHASMFYANAFWLVPKFWDENKVAKYVLLVSLITILLVILDSYISMEIYHARIVEEKGEEAFQKRHGEAKGGMSYGRILLMIVRNLGSVLISFLVSWQFVNKKKSDEIKENQIKLKAEKLETEMKFLKSQINPHFLFNALNNVYALSQMESKKTPEVIMKLSKMLRYVLYECNADKVTLKQEIDYIKNFIDFQQLKTEGRQGITFDYSEADSSFQLSPLLFITFIENSFKHSFIENIETGWVNIKLSSNKSGITLEVKNGYPIKKLQKDHTGGIGLENVKRRLELEYADNYELNIQEGEEEFSVHLELKK